MKRKIKIVIFFNNLKGLQIYNNIKSKINIIKIILSKKYLNRKVVIKLSKEKNKFVDAIATPETKRVLTTPALMAKSPPIKVKTTVVTQPIPLE